MTQNNEFSLDKEIKRTSDSVLEITEKFKNETMMCINCPLLKTCPYVKKRLDKVREKAKLFAEDVYKEELEIDESAENKIRAMDKRDNAYDVMLRKEGYKEIKNDRCIYERREILLSLQKFVDAGYNINDPRAYLIIKELIGNILNSGRANKSIGSLGLLMKKETPTGPQYYLNPASKFKTDTSKFLIESIEALDRIFKSDEVDKQNQSFTALLMSKLRLNDTRKKEAIESIKNREDDKFEVQ